MVRSVASIVGIRAGVERWQVLEAWSSRTTDATLFREQSSFFP